MSNHSLLLLLTSLLLTPFTCSCQQTDVSYKFYQFNQPDQIYSLPSSLNEISGLTLLDQEHLLANEDENGIIYNFNLSTGQVEQQWKFGEGRDYEGIALHQQDAFVVESDGDIFHVQDYQSSSPQVEKYENELERDNNVEGLCYHPEQDVLLLACKDEPGGDLDDDQKAIYSFNWRQKELGEDPFLTIDLDDVEDSILTTYLEEVSHKLLKAFSYDQDQESLFRPSGIAIHPKTKEIFVISANHRLLIILNQHHTMKRVIPLQNPFFRQPEGITFNKKGDLFIANEANGVTPNILYFRYRK